MWPTERTTARSSWLYRLLQRGPAGASVGGGTLRVERRGAFPAEIPVGSLDTIDVHRSWFWHRLSFRTLALRMPLTDEEASAVATDVHAALLFADTDSSASRFSWVGKREDFEHSPTWVPLPVPGNLSVLELDAVSISELRSVLVGEGDVRYKRASNVHGCAEIAASDLNLTVKYHDLGPRHGLLRIDAKLGLDQRDVASTAPEQNIDLPPIKESRPHRNFWLNTLAPGVASQQVVSQRWT